MADRILFVDDDEDDFQLFRDVLGEYRPDIELRWAKDGEQALDYLLRRNGFQQAPRPVIILLDLNMPKLNGLQVAQAARRRSAPLQRDVHARRRVAHARGRSPRARRPRAA